MLTDYMEGDLPPEDVRLIREHLLACPPCLDFLESLERTKQAPGNLRVEVSEECLEALRARLAGKKAPEES